VLATTSLRKVAELSRRLIKRFVRCAITFSHFWFLTHLILLRLLNLRHFIHGRIDLGTTSVNLHLISINGIICNDLEQIGIAEWFAIRRGAHYYVSTMHCYCCCCVVASCFLLRS
jgi:hypothetical protein